MTEPFAQYGTCLIDRCPRDPNRGLVCDPCRQWIRDQLDEIDTLWPLIPDELLTAGGGVNLTALDLLTPVPSALSRRTAGGVHDTLLPRYRTEVIVWADPNSGEVLGKTWHREPVLRPDGTQDVFAAGDQTGPVPLTGWCDAWVQHWRELRGGAGYREALPVPTIDRLTRWLRMRVDWAASYADSAVDDMAAELHEQVRMLRRVTHMAPVRKAVACPGCETTGLVQFPNSRWIECRMCGRLLSGLEYDQLQAVKIDLLEMGAA
jgi:hypothetical protein